MSCYVPLDSSSKSIRLLSILPKLRVGKHRLQCRLSTVTLHPPSRPLDSSSPPEAESNDSHEDGTFTGVNGSKEVGSEVLEDFLPNLLCSGADAIALLANIVTGSPSPPEFGATSYLQRNFIHLGGAR